MEFEPLWYWFRALTNGAMKPKLGELVIFGSGESTSIGMNGFGGNSLTTESRFI